MAEKEVKVPIVGHTMQSPTVTDALILINTMGGRAVQVSLGDAGSRKVQPILDKDAATALRICQQHGFYVVVHGKYLYNFCRPFSSTGWQQKLLESEMKQAAKIDADVIIHQGNNVKELNYTQEQAHQAYADNISAVLELPGVKALKNCIVLENSARQGTECGYTLDSLIDIYRRIPDRYHPRIKFCIDLCHIFVAGELDVRDGILTQKWFERFDKEIGYSKLACIHFNDSDTDFNGANDNHGSIGRGYIGRKSTKGFEYVCQLSYKHNIPLILETSSEHIQSEIVQLKLWCKN